MQLKNHRQAGFTLVEIMIVVAIIGLLAAIAIPNFVKARTTAQKTACIQNMKRIDASKEQWALENKMTDGTATAGSEAAINAYMKSAPVCPGGGTYTYNAIGTAPSCSLSASGHTL